VARSGDVDLARGEAVGFRRVTVAFALSGGGSYPAVAATDLAVGAHEFVAIVGPTGCGKSTLLNLAAGLLAPSSGEVLVLGAPLTGLNMAAGYLFQQDAVMPWKTARDNVAIGLEVAGIARAEAVARARAWLERTGLGAFGERYPHQLSGGQRKRVGLAQVLMRGPKILLMDEPFGPLDAQCGKSWATCCSSYGPKTARRCCSSRMIWRRRSSGPIA